MQILWERGFLDPSKNGKELMSEYNVNFKQDKQSKEDIPGTSAKALIKNLPDFEEWHSM